jgi:hypothetical protein
MVAVSLPAFHGRTDDTAGDARANLDSRCLTACAAGASTNLAARTGSLIAIASVTTRPNRKYRFIAHLLAIVTHKRVEQKDRRWRPDIPRSAEYSASGINPARCRST